MELSPARFRATGGRQATVEPNEAGAVWAPGARISRAYHIGAGCIASVARGHSRRSARQLAIDRE